MSTRKIDRRRSKTQGCKNLQVERLEHRRLLAGDLELVKDINSIVNSNSSSSPQLTTLVGSTAYFVANTADHGQELWKSDGTAAGTVLVKDIRVGNYGSYISSLTNVNGVLFFSAFDAVNGLELWKSNGTAAGTVLVKDIMAGSGNSSPSRLTNVGGTLYFAATDATLGRELWKSDGTQAGTVQVKDILVGSGSGDPRYLVDVSGMLYFSANDGSSGQKLWKSDGTSGGTTRVKDIVGGAGNSNPRYLTNVSGSLYFNASDGTNGYELWKSNGTDSGTTLVKDVFSGVNNSSFPNQLTNVNGKLFFTATDATNGNELWTSDGTDTGTALVKDILSGVSSSGISSLTTVGNTAYFRANDGVSGFELWKSDGTNTGTVLVKDIISGVTTSIPRYLTNVNGILYFNANDNVAGNELWKSDGTTTTLVTDILPSGSSSPTSLANLNGNLLFSATGVSPIGNELWLSDGTGPGTVLVKDINKTTSNSSPQNGANVNGTLFFSATDGVTGYELWKSDGTNSGTVQVLDINTGSSGSAPNYITDVGGTAFFAASTPSLGLELWKSDGTPTGTTLVKEIVAGTGGANPVRLTNVGGTLYFLATDAASGTELWKSDGTSGGTVLVKDITAGTSSSSINYLTNVGGILYFSANSRLWKSDGTAAGTVTLGTVASPQKLMQSKGLLFFSGSSAAGQELWKSDGTEQGTQLIRDIYPGSSSMASSTSVTFVDVAGTVYFNARDAVNGFELWKTDGTLAGTQLVKDIYASTNSSYPRYLTNVSGTLYFRANNGSSGYELWKSDGTADGTVQVKEINTNSSSSPVYLTNVGGTLYFAATDDVSGLELWKSDGTNDGTVLATDLRPGSFSSSPQPLRFTDPRRSYVEAGKKLYVRAFTSAFGTELFAVDATGPNVLSGKTIFDYVGNSDLTLRKNGSKLELVETPAGLVVASGELSSLDTLTINNAPSITINYSTGGLFSLPGGIRVNAKAGSSNSLTITGTGTSQAAYSTTTTTSPTGQTQVVVTEGGISSTVRYSDFEVLRFDNMLTFGGSSALEIGTGSLTIGSVVPANLPFLTTLAGGTLAASSVALGSGEAIIGSGNVSTRFSGELGSLIQLTGDLAVGNVASSAGVNTRGDVIVSNYTLTLLDSNQAVLGSMTSLGSATAAGAVIAANGALVDFGNNIVGYGSLQTPNVASKPTMINGSVEGTSIANPITLPGFIKGVGTLNNVSITGTYSPGFSPAVVELGSVSYGSSSVTVVELGGTTPGLQHDQLNHIGQALLGGALDLELINGYQPTLGASFTILTATSGISGTFNSIDLPPLASGLEWLVSYGTQSVILSVKQINYAPTDLALSSSTIAENRPANSTVGSLSTVDSNSGDTFNYSLVTGNGSADNGAFTIVGSQLVANTAFNFETKNSYAIRVRTTDSGLLFFEKELTITVENVLEMPTPVQIGDGTTQRSVVNKLVVSFDQAIEFDAGAFQVYQRVKDSNNALVLVPVTTNVTLAATANGMTATLIFSGALTRTGTNALVDGNYQLTIDGGLVRILNTTKTFDADSDGNGGGLFTLGNQAADNFFALLGDANGNGEVDAQDLLGAKLALRKTIGQSGYNSAYDVNGNGVVDAQDILNIQLNLRKKRVFF